MQRWGGRTRSRLLASSGGGRRIIILPRRSPTEGKHLLNHQPGNYSAGVGGSEPHHSTTKEAVLEILEINYAGFLRPSSPK
mmetsp:Transcript_34299/g.63630  ORF Transcript_34299/g.63630 Transcript_34299/m.63630 type:complete len:81 (-) Transcript_34299:87-329(-)